MRRIPTLPGSISMATTEFIVQGRQAGKAAATAG
jgi:hypothetical protein|tara:strand:- start:868 stop:969 length:102 start_codon:yes stop_codon:yes gene_type:complete